MQGRKAGLRALVQARRLGLRLTKPLVWAVLFGLLFLSGAAPASANPFTELPAGHWSFAALAGLVSSRLIAPQDLLDPQAGNPVMRFELALVVAKAVRALNRGPAREAPVALDPLLDGYRVGSGAKARPLTPAEREAVRALVAEFLPELEVLGLSFAGRGEPAQMTPASEPLPLAPAPGTFVDLDDLSTGPAQVAAAPASAPSAAPEPVPASSPAPPSVAVPAVAAEPSEPPSLPSPPPPEAPMAPAAPGETGLPVEPLPEPASGLLPVVAAVAPMVNTPAGAAVLPEDALTRQGTGALPGQVVVETQSTYEAIPSAKPVIAVAAAVQTGETRLPVPGVKVSVAPTVTVNSEVAPGGAIHPQVGSVEVQAKVQIAGVEMGASVKNVQALEPQAQESLDLKVGGVPEQHGVGLSLRLGQVAFMTDFSKVRKDEGGTERRRSFGLGYSLGSTAVLRAGYQLVDLDAIGGTKPRTDASLGVNVNVTRVASVSAGMTLEGMRSDLPGGSEGQRTTAGVELRLPWNTFATAGLELYRPTTESAGTPSQSAATVGLGYNFAPNGTLLVGYRLIDFGTQTGDPAEKSREQSLTAGVSLSF